MTTCLAPPPAPHKPPHDRRQPVPQRATKPGAAAPIMRPPDDSGYWHCVCTPRRADLINPVREPTLGQAGAALIAISAAIYTLCTLAMIIATQIGTP